MTDLTPDLLDSGDFKLFQEKRPSWFLSAAGETIRDYCGWHIAPVISVTGVQAKIGNKGIIMLPTLNLVSIERLSWCGNDMEVGSYTVHTEGWVEQAVPHFNSRWHRGMRNGWVTVDFTHGFETVPKPVAEVGYELTGRVLEKPSGVVKHMTRGPTDIDFLEFGAVLSDDQKARLGPYTIVKV